VGFRYRMRIARARSSGGGVIGGTQRVSACATMARRGSPLPGADRAGAMRLGEPTEKPDGGRVSKAGFRRALLRSSSLFTVLSQIALNLPSTTLNLDWRSLLLELYLRT